VLVLRNERLQFRVGYGASPDWPGTRSSAFAQAIDNRILTETVVLREPDHLTQCRIFTPTRIAADAQVSVVSWTSSAPCEEAQAPSADIATKGNRTQRRAKTRRDLEDRRGEGSTDNVATSSAGRQLPAADRGFAVQSGILRRVQL